jgi:hypothetical protein
VNMKGRVFDPKVGRFLTSEVTYRAQRRASSSHKRGTYGAPRRAFREGL